MASNAYAHVGITLDSVPRERCGNVTEIVHRHGAQGFAAAVVVSQHDPMSRVPAGGGATGATAAAGEVGVFVAYLVRVSLRLVRAALQTVLQRRGYRCHIPFDRFCPVLDVTELFQCIIKALDHLDPLRSLL